MTPEVIALLRRLEPQVRPFERIALLSPSREERALLPSARVLGRADWDLDHSRRDLRFDLIIACHVFHYTPDAASWLSNVRASCRALLMFDLVSRKRSADSEFGPDGDRMRYAIGAHRPRVPHYELNGLGDVLLAHHVFAGQPNEHGTAKHLLALIRGELAGPLIRVDGCPVATEEGVLERFARAGAQVAVGVSPARLEAGTLARLRDLPWIECALQGTDEFRWSLPGTIERALRADHERLERGIRAPVRSYIPPADRLNRRVARALRVLGFNLCLSERDTSLPTLHSDYRGLSTGLVPHEAGVGGAREVIRLDLRAEWQREPSGACDRQQGLLETIQLQRAAAATNIECLAAAVKALDFTPHTCTRTGGTGRH
jgi:hypothetical protein